MRCPAVPPLKTMTWVVTYPLKLSVRKHLNSRFKSGGRPTEAEWLKRLQEAAALNTAADDAARIAALESELELLRRRDAERSAELAARERRIRLLEEALRILQSDRYYLDSS
jgi:hypothetical protein